MLTRAREGFAGVQADPAVKERALKYLGQWLEGDEFADYRPQLHWQIEAGKFPALLDAFAQVLPFGTGGRRGAVGVGPNRMNRWTLTASVQGHCQYLKLRFPGHAEPLSVVLAYDVREFRDNSGVYNPDLPNPTMGLSSRGLAEAAAEVYVANGVEVHILQADSGRFVSTPELSFSIRQLRAHGGLNISASHNPPDDNGGKFYDERGGQPVPPEDQVMSDMVEEVREIKRAPWPEAARSGKVHWLDGSIHKAYIELGRKEGLIPPPKFDEYRVVFTPLHGVGSQTAMEVLDAAGYRPIPVESQMAADGQFPNVTKLPNPEVPESLDRATELARSESAHMVLATDPDADRLGGLASNSPDGGGDFRYLTGNQIGCLVAHYKLSKLREAGRLPASPIVVTTEVTTTLITRIARHFNAQVVDNLLVGFKFIADVLYRLEADGGYEDVQGSPADFIVGTEESHGYLLTPKIRDKDAAGAALLMAELGLDQKRQGRTVGDYLDGLHREFGYFRNLTENIKMAGIEGRQNMTKMLDALRTDPPKQIGTFPVESFEDLRDESGRMGPLKGATDAAGRNVLIFRLKGADGLTARVVLRPSGTEPKAKAYVEAGCAPGSDPAAWSRVDERAAALGADFVKLALATVGL